MRAALARAEAEARRLGGDTGAEPDRLLAALPKLLSTTAQFGARWNLVGDPSPDGVVDEHILESLAVAGLWDGAGGPASIVDVGAGAGLELLVLLLLWPEARGVAVEPRRKRTDFLDIAAALVGVGRQLEVARDRLGEGAAGQLRGRFELATSRATFAPEAWLALAAPLVRPGGRLVAHLPAGEAPTLPAGWGERRRAAVAGRPSHDVALYGRL